MSEKPSIEEKENFAPVRIAKHGGFTLYEISKSELKTLVRGAGSDLFLNVALCSLGIFASWSIALFNINTSPISKYIFFVAITMVSFFIAFVFFILWWNAKRDLKSLIREIENRLPPCGGDQIGSFQEGDSVEPSNKKEPK